MILWGGFPQSERKLTVASILDRNDLNSLSANHALRMLQEPCIHVFRIGELLAHSLVQSKWKLNLEEVWIIFLPLPHVFPALVDVQYSKYS